MTALQDVSTQALIVELSRRIQPDELHGLRPSWITDEKWKAIVDAVKTYAANELLGVQS